MEDLHGMRKMYKMGLDLYLKDYEFPDLEELLKNAIDELHKELKKSEIEKVLLKSALFLLLNNIKNIL